MEFEFTIFIHRPPAAVFAFLRDMDQYPQEKGSPVRVLDKTTDGPTGVGTRYREVVRIMPLVKWEFSSEITGFEPDKRLEYRWTSGSMEGDTVYHFQPVGDGTMLIQRQRIHLRGLLRLLSPIIRHGFSRRAGTWRLGKIKEALEMGKVPVLTMDV